METPGAPPEENGTGEGTPKAEAATAESVPGTAPSPLRLTPALSAGTSVGRYLILKPLGEGGMGVVYVAQDPELDRKVTLKLLRAEPVDGQSGSEGRDRLVREAHAMAKLNHPNVVSIFDSGIFAQQVFLAVELVEGWDLLTWLQAPRSWREVLDVFLQAAKGLSAAHAAGLVHRDFKPENVLISKTGDVKVSDFGLARAASDRGPRAASQQLPTPAASSLFKPITQVGVVSGTLGYIAPELLMGRPSDARTDEFAFCVSLYEALYGEQPFPEQVMPSSAGIVTAPPKGTKVPPWLRKILLRGLSMRPEDRYPTIDALAAALAKDPAVRRRQILSFASGGIVAGAAIGALIYAQVQKVRGDSCYKPELRLAGIWDKATQAQLQTAFAAIGAPGAPATAEFLQQAMARVSKDWVSEYRSACEATRVKHEEPESALNLRLDCLREQRLDLKEAVSFMLKPLAADLATPTGAALMLPVPSECADAHGLALVEPPPPAARARASKLRWDLGRARALAGAGKTKEALALLKPLAQEAHDLKLSTLELSTVNQEALIDAELSNEAQAMALFSRAEGLARDGHLDKAAARFAGRVAMLSFQVGDERDGNRWLERSRDLGGEQLAKFVILKAEVARDLLRGQADKALSAEQKLVHLVGQSGYRQMEMLRETGDLAAPLLALGRATETVAALQKVVADADALLGVGNVHPVTLAAEARLAKLYFDLGRWGEADATVKSLLARPRVQDVPWAALGLVVQSELEASRGLRAESGRTARRALDLASTLGVEKSPLFLDLRAGVAEADLLAGQPQLAAQAWVDTLSHAAQPPDDASWVAWLRLGGWAALDSGHAAEALPLLERALKLSSAHPFYPTWVPRLRYQVAKALLSTHGDRERAKLLVQQAHEDLVGVDGGSDLLVEIEGWQKKTFKQSKRFARRASR